MSETIIVTLRTEHGFCCDFELPATVGLAQLYQRLLTVLQQMEGTEFSGWNSLLLESEAGVLLDLSAALYDYGICSGCYLNIIQGDDACGNC